MICRRTPRDRSGLPTIAFLVGVLCIIDAKADSPIGWGEFVNHARDCKLSGTKENFKLTVPGGSVHDLAIEDEGMRAPRVLSAAVKDFTVEVGVKSPGIPKGAVAARRNPTHCAGLLLWQDDRNYVRLEYAVTMREQPLHYILYEQRVNGEMKSYVAPTVEGVEKVRFRANRRGSDVAAAFSLDGASWLELSEPAKLGEQLRVGVAVVNVSQSDCNAEFSDFAFSDSCDPSKIKPAANPKGFQLSPFTPVIRILKVENPNEFSDIRFPGSAAVGSPMFSYDDAWIAFDTYPQPQTNPECWVVKRDGGERRKLAQGATPTWSPDGKKLVFMREKKDEVDSTIWEIGFDGKSEKKLATGRWPTWSPDGKQLAFSRGGEPGLGVRPKSEIFLADADGGNPYFFTIGDCPSWSPDGKGMVSAFAPDADKPPALFYQEFPKRGRMLGIGWYRATFADQGEAVLAIGYVPDRGIGPVLYSLVGEPVPQPFPVAGLTRPESPCVSRDGKSVVLAYKAPFSRSDFDQMVKPRAAN